MTNSNEAAFLYGKEDYIYTDTERGGEKRGGFVEVAILGGVDHLPR